MLVPITWTPPPPPPISWKTNNNQNIPCFNVSELAIIWFSKNTTWERFPGISRENLPQTNAIMYPFSEKMQPFIRGGGGGGILIG